MNGKELIYGLSYIGDDLITRAEFGQFASRRRYRPLLIAALIAAALLMMGCAVLLALNMQNLRLGTKTETRPIFGGVNLDEVGSEDVEVQMLSLAGLKGSPNYLAAQEWEQFTRKYDPDMSLYLELLNNGTIQEDNLQSAPLVYTQEMQDRLDEILTKYGLLPQGEVLNFRTVQNLCTALGIEKIRTTADDVGFQITHGYGYSNGNFDLSMRFTLPEGEAFQETQGGLSWSRADCFRWNYITIDNCDDWKEWNYTTSSGSNVLIFRSPTDSLGWIVCLREEAQMVIYLQVRRETYSGEEIGYEYLTDRQMEQIADAIDFTIQPNRVTPEDVQNQPSMPVKNDWDIILKDVKTDGFTAYLTLGITAPEGTDITHVEADDPVSDVFDIYPGNRRQFFTPEKSEAIGGNWSLEPCEDGDGLDNTQDYRLTYTAAMADGSVPFAEGTVWRLHIEDLYHHFWNAEQASFQSMLLCEGEWAETVQF